MLLFIYCIHFDSHNRMLKNEDTTRWKLPFRDLNSDYFRFLRSKRWRLRRKRNASLIACTACTYEFLTTFIEIRLVLFPGVAHGGILC